MSSNNEKAGYSFWLGSLIAGIMSWTTNQSILWLILPVILGWLYVIYYLLVYTIFRRFMSEWILVENSNDCQCPKCNSFKAKEFGALVLEREDVYYPVHCPDCGENYRKYVKFSFDGKYVEVKKC